MKYFFGDVIERYDGLEFTSPVVVKAFSHDDAAANLTKATAEKKWRDEPSIEFDWSICKEITSTEFEVLSKYLPIIS